jgi:UDP-N-acetyl-2-amino-2-deoxyglucuronate dehydrogenase
MKNFILIGAAGYIAPRHIRAIKETNNNLLAIFDPFDSVGFIDSYFPQAAYFREFERLDRHVEKLKHEGIKIDYVSVCSPNYLHDAHIRFGLRHGADVICEKPIVLNPWNIDRLIELEQQTQQKVYSILQLRHHPSIIALREKIMASNKNDFNVSLQYITSRGAWYHHSWKGDVSKSGGIATNIGIHFFDMLTWIFGSMKSFELHTHEAATAKGILNLERAQVQWKLSIDENELPKEVFEKGQRTFRSIKIDDEELEFSEGFTDLHTVSYHEILAGRGFGLADARESVVIASKLR